MKASAHLCVHHLPAGEMQALSLEGASTHGGANGIESGAAKQAVSLPQFTVTPSGTQP